MKRKAESDLLEQKEKKAKPDEVEWKECDDPRINPGCVYIWIHWNKFLEPPDKKTPPYRISLTGPRIAATNDEPTHHYTCNCSTCGDHKCYDRVDHNNTAAPYQWKTHRRDMGGKWSSTKTAYNIDPWWTNWTIRIVHQNDLYWFQFPVREFITAVRQGFPVFIPNVLLDIVLGYANDRPKNPLAKLGMPDDREEPEAECVCDYNYRYDSDVPQDPMGVESVGVFFDSAVLINIEKS
jgi:hypothetical protein